VIDLLPDFAAQIAAQAPGVAGPAADLVVHTVTAGSLSKSATDILKASWGGKIEKHPPPWVPQLAAVVFGIVAMGLIALMLGYALTDGRVAGSVGVIGGGLASTVADRQTQIHNAARTPPPPSPRFGQTCATCGQPMGERREGGGGPVPLDAPKG